MASNDQILAALAKMSENIADLRVQVSAVPEIKERTDELVRAIKGHNGGDGLLTRATVQETILRKHLEEAGCMKNDLQSGIDEIRQSLLDHKSLTTQGTINELKDHVRRQNDRVIDETKEISKEDRAERRDARKDGRKFRYDLLLAILLMVANLVLSVLQRVQIMNLLP